MILLMIFIVCASANEEVEILVDGVWRLVPAETKGAAAGEDRFGRQFKKLAALTNINTERCPSGVKYSKNCDECIECPECHVFNDPMCKCLRQPLFACRPSSPSNPAPQPPVPSDDLSDEKSIAYASVTLVPITTVNIPKMPTNVTTTSTNSPSTLVPTTIFTSSEIPTTMTATPEKTASSFIPSTKFTSIELPKMKGSSTFVPTLIVTTSKIPPMETTTSTKVSNTFIPNTKVTTTEMRTTTMTTSTEAASTFAPVTIVATSEMPSMVTTTSTVTPSTFVPAIVATTSEISSMVNATSIKASSTFVQRTMITTSEVFTSTTTMATSTVPVVSTSSVTTSQIPTTTTDPWLDSGRCGTHHRLPDGSPGQCNPQGEHPCCNPKSGWCGSTSKHCACKGCVDYRDPWLHSGGCGPQHLLPSGHPAQCDPQGEHPCCNPISGWCGNTKAHCACRECTNYKEKLTPLDVPSEELSTTSSKDFDTDPWLYGGRCGPQHPLPDGRPGQCNPKGEHPCCNSVSGWCGNTKGHCACKDCIDYSDLKGGTS